MRYVAKLGLTALFTVSTLAFAQAPSSDASSDHRARRPARLLWANSNCWRRLLLRSCQLRPYGFDY